MREALLLGIRLHGLWFFEALDVRGRYMAPLTPRRLVVLFLLFPAYLLAQTIHWLGFLLDELFFYKYRRVEIKEPLIITGIPSSGTAFIHRTLAKADHRFTTMRAWEALLAPSITERHVLRFLARMDNKLEARPLHKLVQKLDKRLKKTFSHNQEFSLMMPAEDSLTLLTVGASFLMVLAFPASRCLWQLGRFQEMPDDQRQVLVDFYKSCLQKHLYWVGPNRRLLSKNVSFGSWLPDLRFAFPDARYLFCIREPGPALSSQLSAIRPALEFHGTLRAADNYSLELQTGFAHVYRILLKEKQSFLVDHLAVLDHAELKADTAGQLTRVLKQLCVPIDDKLQAIIKDAGRESLSLNKKRKPLGAKSGPEEFNTLVGSIYREILAHPHMTPNELRR